jgi:hypothetical protein
LLAEAESGVEVDVEDVAPVALGKLEKRSAANNAGVVNEDVGAAKRGDGVGDNFFRGSGLSHIDRDGNCLATECGDLARNRGGVAAGNQRDIGAGFRERERHSCAQASRGSGDDGDASVEPETFKDLGHWEKTTEDRREEPDPCRRTFGCRRPWPR